MSRAARFGAVLAMLWAAHDLGDHVAQTDHQAAGKADDWRAMAGHVAGYTAVQLAGLAALRIVDVRPSAGRVLAAVTWSAATHAFLDRRWPVRWLLEHTGSAAFADARLPVIPVAELDDPGRGFIERRVGQTERAQLPLHGPYLADQALHHTALAIAALILATGRHR